VPRTLIVQPLFDLCQISLLREALGEDDLRAMLSELPGAARQAFYEIQIALDGDDLEAVRRRAHSFKGVAGSFGAARLAAIALEFEIQSTSIASIVQRMPSLAEAIDETLAALAGVETGASAEAMG
jgi:HPt (histidine-containing phosphotransfer) domain-containing protein